MKSSASSGSGGGDCRTFDKAREHSIEVYDDNFQRNSILTRSARIRKFKFYQYKPILDSPTTTATTTSNPSDSRPTRSFNKFPTRSTTDPFDDDYDDDNDDILLPRDEVVQGKVGRMAAVQQSKELSELDDEIVQLEKRIADLNGDKRVNSNLDEIFDLVNKKNDLLRRQMQLNILEQEKALEKANEELTKELRSLMSIEDSRKSKAELERQQYLYDQSLALVNKRNELVHHMDDQERGIEDDNALKATLKTVISKSSTTRNGSSDQNCCIQ